MENDENWFFKYWRPAMAWSYLVVTMFDFLLFPILIALYCYYTKTPMIIWDPITLKGGAVYHASMGAVCGVTAWSRGREKIASLQNDTTTTTTTSAPQQVAQATTTTTTSPLAQVSAISQDFDTSAVRRQGTDQ
jgi:hypothetical protein